MLVGCAPDGSRSMDVFSNMNIEGANTREVKVEHKFIAIPQGFNTNSGKQATQLVPITELRLIITQIVREVTSEGKR